LSNLFQCVAVSWLLAPVAQAAPDAPDAGATAPPVEAAPQRPAEPKADPKWYDLLRIRGYTQFRYDNLPSFDVNPDLVNAQGDRYIGNEAGFGIRRARLIVFGDVHPSVAIYLQADFASVVSDTYHVGQLRDLYTDVFLVPGKQLRLRIGQSKVPYGFENLQSSQNRLALDRADPLNSALKDERDLGVFAYWEPAETRKMFKRLVDDNLKGSGDYGVLGFGVYNGQTANRPDFNGNFHVVARASYPIEIGSQILEVGAAAYTGKFRVSLDETDEGTTPTTPDPDGDLLDQRAEASVALYPQPFGFQAEYNIGRGPSQGPNDPTRIESRPLSGGYVQAMYKFDDVAGTVSLIPYVRAQMYNGGKKFETNAPYYEIKEVEFGAEWQFIKPFEVTLAYAIADRTSSSYPYTQEQGQLLRVQAQVNY
jgi:Phosphate-selective porin O and P